MNIDHIRDYYDSSLDYMKHDHKIENPRHKYAKKRLARIVKSGDTVLDLGCGTGITSHYMASELGATVTAVDLSPELIKFARKNSVHKNVEYFTGDIITNTLKDELGGIWYSMGSPYDFITLIDCFEHIQRDRIPLLMDRIRERSHDKTVVFMTVPDGRFQLYLKETKPDLLQIVDEAWLIQEILNEFKSIGYEVVSIEFYGINHPIQYVSFVFVKSGRMESWLNQSYSSAETKITQ